VVSLINNNKHYPTIICSYLRILTSCK